MLHWSRSHLRALAVAVLVSLSTLATWSLAVHELDCYDRDGAPEFVVHDASAHAFRGATPDPGEHPVHCVLCHWTRSFAPRVHSVTLAPSVARSTVAAPAPLVRPVSVFADAQPPLRGPPATPFVDVLA
jgi:hypothetical protein